ncbi:hypothetical protein U14_03192 [Candidatus Moduliflexus flocculans]|uniref:Bacterial membrane protein YfhO n=1 Tax=Candidatus Moduliflexus flocculans TaxID=1499966 RepID=A0A081BNI0_9BACT|nr:hypothetical protein U14_03192 [Candidatus Moduliflexus flocculans]
MIQHCKNDHRFFLEKEFWLLFLLVLIFFYRPLFGGEIFFFRDISAYSFAEKQFWLNSLNAGEIPYWNPYMFGGEPFFNNMFTSSLYPLNLIFFLLPFLQAFNWFIVAHFLFSASSAYFCARTLGLKPVSSVVVGIIYTFSGGMLSLANLPGLYTDMPYLPLMLACWHFFLLERKRSWFLLCVGSGVFQALAWSHEGNELTMLLLLVWTVGYRYPEKSVMYRLFLFGVLTGCILGISAILIVPGIGILSQAGRKYLFSYENFTEHSLHPKRLFELIFPYFSGVLNNYWGGSLSSNKQVPFILNIYFGGGVLLFGVFGGCEKGDSHSVFSPLIRRSCLIIACCFLILSLGKYLPFFHVFYQRVPFSNLFLHSPSKLVVGMLFPMAILAGYASERYFGESEMTPQFRRCIIAITWGTAALFLLIAAAYWGFGSRAAQWMGEFFQQTDTRTMHNGLAHSFGTTASIMFLLALLVQFRRSRYARWQHWVFGIILLLDLWNAGSAFNPYAPGDFFAKPPDILPVIQQEIGDGYLFRDESIAASSFHYPTNDSTLWEMQWHLETFSRYIGGFRFGIPTIFNEDASGLGQKYVMMLWLRIGRLSPEALSIVQKLPVLSLAAVRLIITPEAISSPGVERIAEIPNDSNLRFFLYRNRNAVNRVEFVTEVKEFSLSDTYYNQNVFAEIFSPSFHPRETVLLFKEELASAQSFLQSMTTEKQTQAISSMNPPQIRKRERTLNASTYEVKVAQPGYLVFTEPIYPEWEATVDGKPAPQLRANLAFTAIPIPAGEHIVTRKYVPRLFYDGAWISLGFCVLTVILTQKRFGIVTA